MRLELSVSNIVPSNGAVTRPSLPSTGSRGAGSPASPVLWTTPTSGRPSRPASFPSLGGTPAAPRSSLPLLARRCGQRAWRFESPSPPCWVSLRGGIQLSQVPGEPSCTCPALRPRRSLSARSLRRLGIAFRPSDGVGLHDDSSFRGSITRPAHSLPTLHAHGHPWPRKARFRLVTTLGRAGLVPAGFLPKVSAMSLATSSLPPLPGLSWRTRRLDMRGHAAASEWCMATS